ncbi:hypothetical protein CWI38_0806p0020 [Hamiltosporidium tvaerminnensis]|uniref:Uncharacterized protein n=1 Tax=Hamiltosporidium tvaerminnensis TaxID=1176355 RepID=A0A4Q9LVB1_9MICR|nr:hypothetical protein CWI38_0806p0020 [Hamiltosporidium tvaerminnensis]
MDRLKFCLSKVNLANKGDLLFDDLYDYVHIDEKDNDKKKCGICYSSHCINMIIDTVIPAIKSKFPPAYKKKTIYIQQNNTKPHFSDNDADIVALGSADDRNIKFKVQLANSLDLNVLDLASPHTIDELINCVQDAFHQLEANTLDNVFTTLQACMESIMLTDDGNCYKILHLSKGKLRREGRLLEKYVFSKEAYVKAKSNFE